MKAKNARLRKVQETILIELKQKEQKIAQHRLENEKLYHKLAEVQSLI
jgi:hypothetical protein